MARKAQITEETVLVKYAWIVKFLMRPYQGLNLKVIDHEDMQSIAEMALIQAWRKYDHRQAKFSTYAWQTVRGHLANAVRGVVHTRFKWKPEFTSLEAFPETFQDIKDPALTPEQHVMRECFWDQIDWIGDDGAELLRLTLLDQYTYPEIAKMTGKTWAALHLLAYKSRERLRSTFEVE